MTVAERNHYLPQFYLEAFLSRHKPSLFWVYDKKDRVLRPQTPINTGVERHLYNLENPDGTIDDSLERDVFAPIETVSKHIIDQLLQPKGRLAPEHTEGLAWFLAFMATRVPRSIRAVQEVGQALALHTALDLAKKPDQIKRALNALREQGKLDPDVNVEEAQRILERADDDFRFSMNEKAAMTMSLVMTATIVLELAQMNWCLCRAPSGSYFICSDSPLVCFVLNSDGMAAFGGGYGLPGAAVTLPISPEKCLYIDRKHSQPYRAVSKKIVKEINKRTAWAAERFIISTYKTEYFTRLCKWASASINLPKMDKKEMLRRFEAKRIFD